MVIAKPAKGKKYAFQRQSTFAKKCQQKVMTMLVRRIAPAALRGENCHPTTDF
jgi:hypothetical protein